MVEEKKKAAERESLHAQAERRALYVIIDAVFGLSLGLGAFSLTELPITNAQDLFVAVGLHACIYNYLEKNAADYKYSHQIA